ncbi:hypothetical protein ACX0MV_07640 [Pseudomonas borbori]
MIAKVSSALLICLLSTTAFADACYISTRSLSTKIPAIEGESCYEYRGVEEASVAWSCSNESEGMMDHQKKQLKSCPGGSFGTCTAALTQETLANHNSISDPEDNKSVNIPTDAKIVTYFYKSANKEQTKTDCENGGGTWQVN